MRPQPDTYMFRTTVGHKIFELLIRPLPPESFEDIVFKTQLRGFIGKMLLHLRRAVAAPIEIFPHSPPRPDPGSMNTLGKKRRVRRRTEIMNNITIDQGIKMLSPARTTRHGVVIVPSTTAGFASRATSSAE